MITHDSSSPLHERLATAAQIFGGYQGALMQQAADILAARRRMTIFDRHNVLPEYPGVREAIDAWIADPTPRFDDLTLRVREDRSLTGGGRCLELRLSMPVGSLEVCCQLAIPWWHFAHDVRPGGQMIAWKLEELQRGLLAEVRKIPSAWEDAPR